MGRKTLLKTLLKNTDPKQQVEIVVVSFPEDSTDDETDLADDEDPFKIVYFGHAQNVPEEYEKQTIWYWGVRIEDTMFIILDLIFTLRL